MSKVTTPTEPVATKINCEVDSYRINLVTALNWFNAERDKKDAKKYIEDFATKHGISLGSVNESEVTLTMGWLARLSVKGAVLSQEHHQRLVSYISNLKPPKRAVAMTTAPRISIQESTQNKIKEYLGELEGVFDTLAKDPRINFSLLDDLKKHQLPQSAGPEIQTWSKSKLRELIDAYEGKDKDLAEGYSNFKKKDLMLFIKKLGSFIEEAEKYSSFKKANRKPRQKKVKPAGQQVKDIKYKVKDEELKISSVLPSEMVGSSQVWVFNAKTRKLSVYKTDSAMGIQVKGTTLQNYDPDMSCQKTLRKPEQQLKELLAAGKVQLRKFMDNVKAVASVPNGRINADTLIVRVVK